MRSESVSMMGKGQPGETLEIRLRETRAANSLLFTTVHRTDDQTVAYARELLERHPEFDIAEIWRGMTLLREV